MNAPRPTLRSLAAEAGVTAITVSRALRNSQGVSDTTRRRIERLAKARGYRPDPEIAKLMHYLRTRSSAKFQGSIWGLSQRLPPGIRISNDYRERLLQGLRQRAASLGFAFNEVQIEDYASGAHLQRVLLNRGIEGLVIMPLFRPADLSSLLNWHRFATVSVTPSLIAPLFHRAMPNHFDNIVTVCKLLERAGYRRIGLVVSIDQDVRTRHRLTGGITWQNAFGRTNPVQPLVCRQPGIGLDPVEVRFWLHREKPDAVITGTAGDSGLSSALESVPLSRRPRIITMNWPDPCAIAGIDPRPELVGCAAIDILAGLIVRREKAVPNLPFTTMVDGVWQQGQLPIRRTKRSRVGKSVF